MHSFVIRQGSLKGLKLFFEANLTTRPTKSRVKTSLMDKLRNLEARDKMCFIECFSGSGQIGFEALSVGFGECVFFEVDKLAYANLTNNIKLCKTRFPKVAITSFQTSFLESRNILKTIKKPCLLYLDPPFSIREGFSDIYESTAKFLDTLKQDINVTLCILEFNTDIDIEQFFNIESKASFGKTSLAFIKP
ncbi:RsmD family RNA methyltransferase [Helicobacter sp. 11S02629-2]|uniref:RsmD family RNA methyltransferase n=1 Tax=Helicobacter sp. 11S02629-2 TaxID=1476195 RepID=UPI000BA7645F|nr:RsmD family RNA methyltransferase [Helicobacter sp. 11S02629-2]PAF45692.1 hypothetical protein BKH40_02085 [Helicobacter sp. 11S02629-2]